MKKLLILLAFSFLLGCVTKETSQLRDDLRDERDQIVVQLRQRIDQLDDSSLEGDQRDSINADIERLKQAQVLSESSLQRVEDLATLEKERSVDKVFNITGTVLDSLAPLAALFLPALAPLIGGIAGIVKGRKTISA